MRARVRACLVVLTGAVAAAGCGGVEEDVNPLLIAPVPVADASVPPIEDAGTDAPPPEVDAGPPRRTVSQRNPFGNVAEAENLLWDGDFEWTSPFSDQYGWLAGPPFGYTFTNARIGAACRSGLKCAAVAKKKAIVGIAVASKGNKLLASFWAHLPVGECDKVKAYIATLFDNAEPDAPITPVSPAPDAERWCHYESLIDARVTKPYFFIENKTTEEIIVDDVVLKKAPPSMAISVKPAPVPAEDAASLAVARAGLRALRGPHDPPPNAAKRALEAWKTR